MHKATSDVIPILS